MARHSHAEWGVVVGRCKDKNTFGKRFREVGKRFGKHAVSFPSRPRAMLRHWYYSLVLLVTYVSVFLIWKHFPSRASFVLAGAAAVTLLTAGLFGARRRGYFVNRVDLCLHAYIIADLFLESLSFEVLALLRKTPVTGELVSRFHDNNNYAFCTIVLAGLVGGYRWYALTFRPRSSAGPRPFGRPYEHDVPASR